ncbi:MAG: HAD family hydrolase [Magnetovibrio sp.]|nr:HAD family hydrolase [Magnetovibrio sp.]
MIKNKKHVLSKIKLLSLDVDGILTDGGLYYNQAGEVTRKFNVRDGVGIEKIQEAGVRVAIISAGTSSSILHRAKRLKIFHVHTGVRDKLKVLQNLSKKLSISFSNIAHMGDDLNDIHVMKKVGCPITVADGVAEVKKIALIITDKSGGMGAVREICDQILRQTA